MRSTFFLLFTLFITAVKAQEFPTRPVTIILNLAVGTGQDIVARTYGERLAQSLGKPVLIDNKPGAFSAVAINTLKAAPADGHTLLVLTSAAMAIQPSVMKQLSYDPAKDFVPVALYLKSPFVLVVPPSLPVTSVPEFIEYAKARPGKLSFSSTGPGSAPFLAMELLKQTFNLDLVHVPYKNTGQMVIDIAAGRIEAAFAEAGATQSLIRDGRLKALAVSSLVRFDTLTDVPTMAEASGKADFEAVSWHVLLAPAGVPRPIIERLHAEMSRIVKEPAVQERIVSTGLIPIEPLSIEGAQKYIAAEAEKWGQLVGKLGLAGSQ